MTKGLLKITSGLGSGAFALTGLIPGMAAFNSVAQVTKEASDLNPDNKVLKTIADIPENYLTVTYSLSDSEGNTNLTVTQGDYNKVADGENRYNEAMNAGGWESILAEIKKVVETN